MKPILVNSMLWAAVATWCAPAAAQWASTAYDSSNPVVAEGFFVLHENANGFCAFSAAAQQWKHLPSYPGTYLVDTGDWVALLRGTNYFTAYSARRNGYDTLYWGDYLSTMRVNDDVALVVSWSEGGPYEAHAYSAVTNAWSSVTLTAVPGFEDVAISRFVIAIRDADAYHGFAARTGAWASLPVAVPGDVPRAKGNVVVVDLTDPDSGLGSPNAAAFSGVRGEWTVSPPYVTWAQNYVHPEDNVGYTRAAVDAGQHEYAHCAYSAYTGTWVASQVVRSTDDPYGILEVSDSVVGVISADGAEAFGAAPATWDFLPGTWHLVRKAASYLTVRNTANTSLAAFSGVATGTWTVLPVNDYPFATGGGPGEHCGLFHVGSNLVVPYSPAKNTFGSPLSTSTGSLLTNEDALCDVRTSLFVAYAGRKGEWTLGPLVPAASLTRRNGGSVVVHQVLDGPSAGDLYLFDERTSTWNAPYNPGGVATLTPDRNLVVTEVLDVPTPIRAYSAQRADWTAPPGFVPPALTPPRTEENVAWVVDGAGNLWAYGSPSQGHVYHAWPNGTEYHTSGAAPQANVPYVAYGIQANPGDLVWVSVATRGQEPPLVIPGIGGALGLDPTAMFSLGFWGAVDGDGLLEQFLYLFGPLPAGVELRFQPLIFDVVTLTPRWGHRCDPAWFF